MTGPLLVAAVVFDSMAGDDAPGSAGADAGMMIDRDLGGLGGLGLLLPAVSDDDLDATG